MSELISGREALIALANGEEVELNSLTNGGWVDAKPWAVEYFITDNYEFRLKPRTIYLNGIEVPAPFEPKGGEDYFFIANGRKGYNSTYECDPICCFYGAWRSEEEIKQVVAALRSAFGKK